MPSTRELQAAFRPFADWLLRVAREYGGYRITSGRRSTTYQAQLYSRWLAGEPGIYTPAPPGRSQHEKGWAFDMAQPGVDPQEDEFLATLGAYWRSLGGVWGGEKDPVHFEAPKSWTGRV